MAVGALPGDALGGAAFGSGLLGMGGENLYAIQNLYAIHPNQQELMRESLIVSQQQSQLAVNPLLGVPIPTELSFRESLQAETDEWLKNEH